MRGELASLTTYFGFPVLFVTLNPADVLHPFTWRYALNTEAHPLPDLHLDTFLLEALRSANLWKVVAEDPTAAVEAFHTHVNAFLQVLLDVPSNSRDLPIDGTASKSGAGIFGPLNAIFGSVEPQQRGSLHIHFLLFCYSFDSPHNLLHKFAAHLRDLESALWRWIQSIVVTAFESVPSIFDLPASALQSLRPLPYADANVTLMHPSYSEHVRLSTENWFAGSPETLLPAVATTENPFDFGLPCDKPFVPWCLDYVTTLQHPLQEHAGKLLLFDLRASVLASGLLRSCQPRTCYKGKLGQRGYCRLGFWHWLEIAPHTWERCHGIQLCPRALLGTTPPHRDTFQTERHRQFFGRMNPFILAAIKCNHDVSTLLRFPADVETASDAATSICHKMSTNMSTLLFCVTCYTTKTQPHLTSLWSLLTAATQKLQTDISSGALPAEDPRARARATLSRLLLSCQKRVHKSMQEMISYLLGYDEAYCTHSFHKLYFFHLAARLEIAFPLADSNLASVEPRSCLFLQPNNDDADGPPTAARRGPSFWSPSSDDYPYRGPDLQTWPLYFYAAGVTRVQVIKSTLTTPGCIPFAPQHPDAYTVRQQVLTNSPWRIPHLMGPRIPSSKENSEKRAMLLLLLFKPWMHLQDLLPTAAGFTTWSDHLTSWLETLQQSFRQSLNTRAPPFTPPYWAQRTLHILDHIDNLSQSDPTTADRELRCNPDELRGVPNSVTVEAKLPPDPHDTDSDDSAPDGIDAINLEFVPQDLDSR